MLYNNKFNIRGLKNKRSFTGASKVILDHKIKIVFKQIIKYKKDDSAENLHTLRIAIRRFRYVMEIFYGCIKPKLFKNVYDTVTKLQDMLGEVRDYDILEGKVHQTEIETGNKIPDSFYEKINNERARIKSILMNEITNFITDKNIKKLRLP